MRKSRDMALSFLIPSSQLNMPAENYTLTVSRPTP